MNAGVTGIGLIDRAAGYGERLAVVDQVGETTYGQLVQRSGQTASAILQKRKDLDEARVAFMVDPGARYIEILWGVWSAGGIAVPLCLTHPEAELEYAIGSTGVELVIAGQDHFEKVSKVAARLGIAAVVADEVLAERVLLPKVSPERRAMMLFTSGTTGRPKGVVTTHANIDAQVRSLIEAWGWSSDDRILLTLPLHHLHGILNVVTCSLEVGAVCEMHSRFDAEAAWDRIESGQLTLYMAVPTIYHRLIAFWDAAGSGVRQRLSSGAKGLRLMVSGSAALPVPVLERWREISGHVLLERYGMTEIGMALSNPLGGERRPGFVGQPLPGVEVRLVDEVGVDVTGEGTGEIQVRGPNVFLEYWNDKAATDEAFTGDSWFRTGDIAQVVDGAYRILGRESVDILKTGGEKVSALEVESVLLEHGSVQECAVVGIDDEQWGQKIVAAIVGDGDANVLRDWCRDRLAPFKVPKEFLFVADLPRNAMGKVQKKAVELLVEGSDRD